MSVLTVVSNVSSFIFPLIRSKRGSNAGLISILAED